MESVKERNVVKERGRRRVGQGIRLTQRSVQYRAPKKRQSGLAQILSTRRSRRGKTFWTSLLCQLTHHFHLSFPLSKYLANLCLLFSSINHSLLRQMDRSFANALANSTGRISNDFSFTLKFQRVSRSRMTVEILTKTLVTLGCWEKLESIKKAVTIGP